MRGRCPLCALAASSLLWWSCGNAMTLGEAFEAARIHDPQYRAAAHELEAARQGVPIARAGLLPQLSLGYSSAGVEGRREFPNALQQEVSTRVDYTSAQSSLSLRMPLFNYEAWSRLDQATAQGRGAEALYRARSLELVERVVLAYLNLLQSRAQQSLAQAEVQAMTEQQRRTAQRLLLGEGTRTDDAMAQAALEISRARLTDATELVDVAAARLRRLTGQRPSVLQDTSADFLPARSGAEDARDWIDRALLQNPALVVREAAVEAARHGIRRSLAGHLPRLDLVGSVARARNDSLSNLDQTSTLRSLGVQLSIPLFSGGGVDASVQQAQADLARAQEELRAERENNELEIVRQLQLTDSAAQRSQALMRAIAAGQIALTGARRSQESGLGTFSDVLEAYSRLQASRRDLAQARYDHLVARARLMLQAGEPARLVIDRIDAALSEKVDLLPPPINVVPRS